MNVAFASANLVIGWFGDPTDDSDLATSFMETLYTAARLLRQQTLRFTAAELCLLPSCVYPSRSETTLSGLFRRPWFRRIWIVQGIVVARATLLICGHSAVRWDILAEVALFVNAHNLQSLVKGDFVAKPSVP